MPSSPAPPSYASHLPPPTHRRTSNPASRCAHAVRAFFRPFSSSYLHDDALHPADPATLELRRRHNLAIQQALVDAGLMLPPIRRGPRQNTAASGYEAAVAVETRGGGEGEGVGAKGSTRTRFWRWLSASGTEPASDASSRVLADSALHRSPTEAHSSSFAVASRAREDERAARHARRQHRREHAAALRDEECISLGLPAYTKTRGAAERSLMGEGPDGSSASDSGGEDGGLEVVARPARVARVGGRGAAVATAWEMEQRV